MKTINSDDLRIPKAARDAVVAHEEVVVLNRDRPVFVLLNPEDPRLAGAKRRGRSIREAVGILAAGPLADAAFAGDMAAVLNAVGEMPEDPWAPS